MTPESINVDPADFLEDARLEWNSMRGTGCGLVSNKQQSKAKKKKKRHGEGSKKSVEPSGLLFSGGERRSGTVLKWTSFP